MPSSSPAVSSRIACDATWIDSWSSTGHHDLREPGEARELVDGERRTAAPARGDEDRVDGAVGAEDGLGDDVVRAIARSDRRLAPWKRGSSPALVATAVAPVRAANPARPVSARRSSPPGRHLRLGPQRGAVVVVEQAVGAVDVDQLDEDLDHRALGRGEIRRGAELARGRDGALGVARGRGVDGRGDDGDRGRVPGGDGDEQRPAGARRATRA